MEINVLDEKAYKSESIYLIIKSKYSKGKVRKYGQTCCDYVLLTEGTGDNLFEEDIQAGYVDYANFAFGKFDDHEFIENDGGMFMRETLIRDSEGGLVDLIEDFIESEYVNPNVVEEIYVFC